MRRADLACLKRLETLECREDLVDLAFVERKHIAGFDDALLDGFGEVA